METVKLRIVKDTPPPKIIAQATLEAFLARAIKKGSAGAHRSVGVLDVDAVLARSLPKVAEVSKRSA